MLWTGRGVDIQRNVLIAFDLLLVVVLGLLLYSVSARDPRAPAGVFDVLQVVLVVSALLADAVALWAIAARISRVRLHPEPRGRARRERDPARQPRLVAVLYVGFLRGRGSFASLERWQTDYLPVYAAWAAIVVVVLPAGVRVHVMRRHLLRGTALLTAVVALAFLLFFQFTVHDPVLAPILPFYQDPFDAVTTFGVIAAGLLSLLSVVRGAARRPTRTDRACCWPARRWPWPAPSS